MGSRHGSLDTLKILLGRYYIFIKPVGRTDLDGRCCRVLNEAAHGGHLEVVKLLLDHPLLQADVHYNTNGFTPIMVAAEASYRKDNLGKKEAVIIFLLDRGARVSDAEYIWGSSLDPRTGEYTKKQMPILTALNFAAE
ncbi:hypothetical protein FVEG_13417 [Fusarium verticillioides 7600]|uniref:Uncharacterized protein n=1 Tax=Gibberella moniliformis (strain M3125 / FGSC 7600) TaxID=334819 RepID=W7N6W4_GIBM7|nr:hypothetical protein FVEG_13417 [Fusarium verticillioides 7600]EWG55414.1 hypothetical protein FVEG_13417 [Fusarium verticillioides 7600]